MKYTSFFNAVYIQSLSKRAPYVVTQHPLLNDVLLVRSENEDSTNYQCCEKEVIVDTSCGSAVLRGADIFAPGVLAAHPGLFCLKNVYQFVSVCLSVSLLYHWLSVKYMFIWDIWLVTGSY